MKKPKGKFDFGKFFGKSVKDKPSQILSSPTLELWLALFKKHLEDEYKLMPEVVSWKLRCRHCGHVWETACPKCSKKRG
jgi:hypothetical protein